MLYIVILSLCMVLGLVVLFAAGKEIVASEEN